MMPPRMNVLAGQAPTIKLFPTTVLEEIRHTGDVAKEMETGLQPVIQRLDQQQEMRPGFQGFDAFIGFGRHLGVRTPVDQIDIFGPKPDGRLDTIHGHRPTADDRYGVAFNFLFQFFKATVT